MAHQEVLGVVVLDDPTDYLDLNEHRIFHNCGGGIKIQAEGVNTFSCSECLFRFQVGGVIGDMIRRMIAHVARTAEIVVKDITDIDGEMSIELHIAPIAPKEGGEIVEAFKEFLKKYSGF